MAEAEAAMPVAAKSVEAETTEQHENVPTFRDEPSPDKPDSFYNPGTPEVPGNFSEFVGEIVYPWLSWGANVIWQQSQVIASPLTSLFWGSSAEVVAPTQAKPQQVAEVIPNAWEEVELLAESNIVTLEEVHLIASNIPPRYNDQNWSLVFSTWTHGYSLNTLYRHMRHYENSGGHGCVLLIKEKKHGTVFGAFTNDSWKRTAGKYIGTGESMVFTVKPETKFFHWTGENQYFMLGDETWIAVGGGQGHFALWLDDELLHGSSRPTTTFGNTTLSPEIDFECEGVELWGLMSTFEPNFRQDSVVAGKD
eukprot:Colp12_sorted_trinity150504_noHs@34511